MLEFPSPPPFFTAKNERGVDLITLSDKCFITAVSGRPGRFFGQNQHNPHYSQHSRDFALTKWTFGAQIICKSRIQETNKVRPGTKKWPPILFFFFQNCIVYISFLVGNYNIVDRFVTYFARTFHYAKASAFSLVKRFHQHLPPSLRRFNSKTRFLEPRGVYTLGEFPFWLVANYGRVHFCRNCKPTGLSVHTSTCFEWIKPVT